MSDFKSARIISCGPLSQQVTASAMAVYGSCDFACNAMPMCHEHVHCCHPAAACCQYVSTSVTGLPPEALFVAAIDILAAKCDKLLESL